MLKKTYIYILLLLLPAASMAQQPENQHIRIMDTLPAKEKVSRVILRSELDSLVKLNTPVQIIEPQDKPVQKEKDSFPLYILIGLSVIIALLGFVIYLFYGQRQRTKKELDELNERLRSVPAINGQYNGTKEKRMKTAPLSSEQRISELNAELHKLSKENESLGRVIKEYNGIQHEYESLKHGMLKAYKVKNYPGYDKSKNETLAMQGVLDTENAVANYAYEKFLKPILAITDINKNNPARIKDEDREKLMDLLVSLSLLYIEYLYLRVSDLSVGGKMVERIKGFSNRNGIDDSLLKQLNTELGSRALVIKMALEKMGMSKLSYPVFDETNLNNQ